MPNVHDGAPRTWQPTIEEAVIEAASTQVRTRADIIDEVTRRCGVSDRSVSAMLSTLTADGVLLRPARGWYCFNLSLLDER